MAKINFNCYYLNSRWVSGWLKVKHEKFWLLGCLKSLDLGERTSWSRAIFSVLEAQGQGLVGAPGSDRPILLTKTDIYRYRYISMG